MAEVNIKRIEEGMTGRQVADLLYENFLALLNAGVDVDELRDDVLNAVHVGSVNMLLNTGFTGDYKDEELTAGSALDENTALHSAPLKYWTGEGVVLQTDEATSGRSVTIGRLSQRVRMQLITGERYVLSFKAKGEHVVVSVGDWSMARSLGPNYERMEYAFTAAGGQMFTMSGDATICDLQLERGNIATDWHASPWDNDASLEEFVTLKYMRDAMRDGATSFIGGLILSSMIQMGDYRDGLLHRVNAGISGLYSDDDDVAFWGGGTMEQAIRTVIKFKQNPRYNPTDEEWKNMANFVVTHGGDAFFRGYIYALGGYFRGKIETSAGGKRIVIDPQLNTMRMYDGLEHLVMEISFGLAGMGNNMARAIFYTYDADGNVATESMVTAGNVSIKNNENNTNVYVKPDAVDFMDNKNGKGLTIGLGTDGINIGGNFWKDAQTATTGQMYVENGFVKIK